MQTIVADRNSMPPACTPEHIAKRVRRMAAIIRSQGNGRAEASMSLLILDEIGRIFPLDGRSETEHVHYRLIPEAQSSGLSKADVITFISSIVRTMRAWRGKRIDAIVLECVGAIGGDADLLDYLKAAFLQEEIMLSPDACVGIINGSDEMWIAGQHGSVDRVLHIVKEPA